MKNSSFCSFGFLIFDISFTKNLKRKSRNVFNISRIINPPKKKRLHYYFSISIKGMYHTSAIKTKHQFNFKERKKSILILFIMHYNQMSRSNRRRDLMTRCRKKNIFHTFCQQFFSLIY